MENNRSAGRPGLGRRSALTLAVIALVAVILLAGGRARGQDIVSEPDKRFEDDPKIPWQITADEISYDDRAQRYVAEGNVRITKGDRRLTADHVRFDHRTMQAEAKGHVVLVAGGDMLFGDRVEIDLEKQTGTITQGTIFLHENHFYIRGEKIEKLGPREYAIEKASLSSCDGERPSWRITGRKLDVEVEGRGVVKHAALWAKDVPVFYTPIFTFPATTKRKSGFLMPEFGTSDRKGNRLLVPFFWAINEQSDMTFYNDYMVERGNK
nr:LptA/OstA family protein [Desulfobacterales bacterium]